MNLCVSARFPDACRIDQRDGDKTECLTVCAQGRFLRGEVQPGQFLAMNPGTATEEIAGTPTTEPAFGLPAYWIQDNQRDRAQLLGYTVVDGATVITVPQDWSGLSGECKC